MRILGIDPALVKLGWGIIEVHNNKITYCNSDVVCTKNTDNLMSRLTQIHASLDTVITSYNPDYISIEETFVNVNAVSSLKLAYVRGAIMCLVGKYKSEIFEYKPNQIKKTVVGSGHADKLQVQKMLQFVVSQLPTLKHLDEIDALAVAYTCYIDVQNRFLAKNFS